jgi:hypothetical protein
MEEMAYLVDACISEAVEAATGIDFEQVEMAEERFELQNMHISIPSCHLGFGVVGFGENGIGGLRSLANWWIWDLCLFGIVEGCGGFGACGYLLQIPNKYLV